MKRLMVFTLVLLASCLWGFSGFAQESDPTVFISGSGEFAGAITAAFTKKKVPATVVLDKGHAAYILRAAEVDSKNESGAGKIARCMFMECIGMNGYSSVSVELIQTKDSAVVWAYQVRKGNSGPIAIQSLSEAVAKHLKKDYFKKQNRAW